jgi:colanic acid/amylovoran biosynthesis glycosyltransferase
MRIAFVVYQFPAISETFILNQITGLIDRGCEVDIYTGRISNQSAVHPDVQKYELLNRTYCLTPSSDTSPLSRFFTGTKHLAANFMRNPSVTLNSLNAGKFGRAAVSLARFYQSHLFLSKDPYDIVHCQYGPNGKLGLRLRETGVLQGKIITHFRGNDASSYVLRKGRDVYNDLFQKADLFLCVSQSIRSKLVELGCKDEKILVHRSGVDIRRFGLLRKRPCSNGGVRLLTIGRLVEKKGIQYGIQAVAEVLRTNPEIEYKIVGDGPLKKELLNLIEELKLSPRIHLLGWKRQDEIVEILEDTDILLAPSVTADNGDEEGVPNVLMEALARGLPVLSTYHGGVPEIVRDGKSGFLVPERDVAGMAAKLRLMIENRLLWTAMGEEGRKTVEENFNIDKLNDRLLTIYQELRSARTCSLR